MFSSALIAAWLLAGTAGSLANVTGMKDPTRPLGQGPAPTGTTVARAAGHPTLESVLIGAGRRVAVINGQRMTEGEERQGVKVWEIRSDGVVVSVDGSPRLTLEIGNSHMRKDLR